LAIDQRMNRTGRRRDRWEYSHFLRTALGMASLILLVTAIAIGQ
jgi:hypothetical protein